MTQTYNVYGLTDIAEEYVDSFERVGYWLSVDDSNGLCIQRLRVWYNPEDDTFYREVIERVDNGEIFGLYTCIENTDNNARIGTHESVNGFEV